MDEANLETNLALAKVVSDLAAAKGTTAASLSLAWLLHQAAKFGVALLPIPGRAVTESLPTRRRTSFACHTVLLERRCATCSTARADQLSLTQFWGFP